MHGQEPCRTPKGTPPTAPPCSPAVPQSSTVKVCSKLFLPKGGSLGGQGGQKGKSGQ